jgi:fatty-acyl-CoA synthase
MGTRQEFQSMSHIDRDFAAYHAGVRPDKVACIELNTGRQIAYGELDARVSKAVAAIQGLCGDVRGVPLSLLARNSIEYLVFIVACFRLGAVLQPLNWRLGSQELGFLLSDADPALVIYDEEFSAAILPALDQAPGTVAMNSSAFAKAVEDADGTKGGWAAMGPDAPFFLLYTSGTTGKPKGAIITRSNAWYQALNFAVCADVKVDSVMLCDAPMFHTVGLMATCWCSLRMGATFAITERFTPALAIERLLDPKIGATHYFGVPQIARALMDDPTYVPQSLNRLAGFFLGGAPMPHDLLERMVDDRILVSNGFGMSESGTCMHVPRTLETIRHKFGSVGLPAITMEAKVVDEDGHEVADGTPGELVLNGPAVTPGYWNRPEANASGFFPGGWFRSGDIGMRDADGYFYVLDRSKDMYISGGENVYPAEVESAILRVSGVADVAVIGVPDERWGEVGCAYVVLKPGVEMDAATAVAAWSPSLASYKRPKHVRFIAAIPRNANGKAQKQELRALPL